MKEVLSSVEAEVEAEAEADVEVDAGSDVEVEVGSDAEVEAEAEAEAEAEVGTKAEVEAEVEAGSEGSIAALMAKLTAKTSLPWIIAACGAVVVIILVIVLLLPPATPAANPDNALSQSEQELAAQTEQAEAALINTGSAYYQDFFHGQMADSMDEATMAEFLASTAQTGLLVSMDNLARFAQNQQGAEALETLLANTEGFDSTQSKVNITPVEPYGAGDFEIEAIMVASITDGE